MSTGALSDTSATVSPTTAGGGRVHVLSGYVLGAVCLALVLRHTDVASIWRLIGEVDTRWVAAALLCDVASYCIQGLRWSILLRPVGSVSTLQSTQTIYVGLFVNEVLPLKVGEIVRAYLMARWLEVDLTSIVPSILVERTLDGVWIAVAVAIVSFVVPLPHTFLEAEDALVACLVITVGAIAWIVVRRRGRPSGADGGLVRRAGLRDRLSSVVVTTMEGIRTTAGSRGLLVAFVTSLALLTLQTLAFWFVMIGFGMRMGVLAAVTVFIVVHLGSALPGAPANIGTYQYFTVLGLLMFGVDKSTAAAFSLVVFVVLTVPLWVLGFVALGRCGTSLATIRGLVDRRKG